MRLALRRWFRFIPSPAGGREEGAFLTLLRFSVLCKSAGSFLVPDPLRRGGGKGASRSVRPKKWRSVSTGERGGEIPSFPESPGGMSVRTFRRALEKAKAEEAAGNAAISSRVSGGEKRVGRPHSDFPDPPEKGSAVLPVSELLKARDGVVHPKAPDPDPVTVSVSSRRSLTRMAAGPGVPFRNSP